MEPFLYSLFPFPSLPPSIEPDPDPDPEPGRIEGKRMTLETPIPTLNPLIQERPNKENSSIERQRQVDHLMQHIGAIPSLLLRLGSRMRHQRDRVAVQQLLAVRHRRREEGVVDGRPARDQRDEPQDRRPGRVREEVDQDGDGRGVVGDGEGAYC